MEQEQFTICDTIREILTTTESELNKQSNILLESLINQVKKASPNIQEQQVPLAIFATLVNLIQTELQDYSPYLLLTNMLINRINVAVVKKLLIQIQNQMVKIMKKDQKYQKYCIVILASTIQIVSKEEFLQNDAHNLEIIKSIIESLWNENSLARKESIKSIKMILEKKFFYKQQISQCIKQFIVENLETEDLQRVVFVTQFIQTLLDQLPLQIIGDINYELIKSLKSENDEISTHIYLCIENIMESRPLSVDITESLLKEFLNNQPSFYKEEKVVQAYGQCMVQTLLHMNTISPKQAKKYITSCIAVLQEILLVENNSSTLPRFAQKSLEVLLEATIDSTLWIQKKTLEEELLDDFLKIEIDTSGSQQSIQFQRIIIMLKHMLTSRYFSKMKYVLGVIGAFFAKIDSSQECISLVEPLLFDFLEFRKEDKIQLSFKKAFGRLVSNIGSEYLLGKFPMSLQGDAKGLDFEDNNNLWLLPYFQRNASKQRLLTFFKNFVPLISHIANSTDISINSMEGKSGQQIVLKSVHSLLWECFPNFVIVNGENLEETQILDQFLENIPTQLNENNQHFGNVLKGLSNLVVNLSDNKNVLEVIKKHAQPLISCLAKLVVPSKQKSKLALNVIGYLAQVAPGDYLDKAFKKNITKLMEDQQNNKLSSNMSNSTKNFDIINQILPSMDVRDTKWDISLQFVKCMLDEESSIQKKAYKFLRILIHKVHQSFIPMIIEILTEKENIQSFSRPNRLLLIKDFYEKMKIQEWGQDKLNELGEFISSFLPELIVGLRDSNKKCRKISKEIFNLVGVKMQELGLLKDFVSSVAAGLAGETSLMKANSIAAVSFLIEQFGPKLDKAFIKELESIIMMLVKEENKEIFKAVLYFLKKYQKNMTKKDLEQHMPQLFKQIFSVSDQVRFKFLTQIKQLLSRLIRKFGIDLVTKTLPEPHQNLPKSIIKQEKQLKKQKEKQRILFKIEEKKRRLARKLKKDQENEQNENDDQIEEEDEENSREKNLLLKFDSDKQNFHFTEKTFKLQKHHKEEEDLNLEDVTLKNGKLIVQDLEALARDLHQEETGKKRKREDRFTDLEKLIMDEKADLEEDGENLQGGRKSVKVNKKALGKKKFVHNIQETGESYRSKDAVTGGDVRLKNKPEPYAFVQLNPKALNKRHRNKAIKSFDQVLGGGGAATLKGLKKKVKQE